jgi:hypothetical protein
MFSLLFCDFGGFKKKEGDAFQESTSPLTHPIEDVLSRFSFLKP